MEFPEILESLFLDHRFDLPGEFVQHEMSPPHRYDLLKYKHEYADAAVAILIYKKDNNYIFPVIKRTTGNQTHSGQISLPGGKMDTSDNTFEECAIRELQEELGIKSENIRTVGRLTTLLIPVSNFRVHPFIFVSDEVPFFYPQQTEVEYVIEVNIKELLDDLNVKNGQIELNSGLILDNIPYFYLNSHIIWGATAMILSEFKNVCKNIKTKHSH
jgi:8-oxo-dGTP pyrophosphatase MutT (NUDIX family)